MEVLHACCCGLDVHKRKVVACLRTLHRGAARGTQMRTFSTMTDELLALVDWLKSAGCTHVAMESTGVYWKPVYNLMEGSFEEILVVNARHLKMVPGRKTDMKDAEWIAHLLQHGLLRGSFIPSAPERAMRDLTRHRSTRVQDRARVVNRLQKVLEDANIKLGSVVSDVTGVSARAMLEALVAGTTDLQLLSGLARGRMQHKQDQLARALQGRFRPHHRFLVAEYLSQIDTLDAAIARVEAQIAEQMRPFEATITKLDTIPGVSIRVAQILIAEFGASVHRFPTAEHLASWAGLCPGNNESAGIQRSGRTRKGNPWLRAALVEAAHGAAHVKNSYLAAQYHRLAARRGNKRALLAVAHTILVIAYHLLTRQTLYHDLGGTYFDERARDAVSKRLIHRLQRMGYDVTISTPAA